MILIEIQKEITQCTTLFLNCGMRLSELVGINIDDIDFSEEKMTVIGKGNKERTIYLNKACIKSYKRIFKSKAKDGIQLDSKNSKKALIFMKGANE